jgi:hypothetical protein
MFSKAPSFSNVNFFFDTFFRNYEFSDLSLAAEGAYRQLKNSMRKIENDIDPVKVCIHGDAMSQ